jgi:transposase-like protein
MKQEAVGLKRNFTPEERAEIARDFVTSGDIEEVCSRQGISAELLMRLRREDRLDAIRANFIASLRKKAILGELRAREEAAFDDAYNATRATIKQTLKELFFDLWQRWLEKREDPRFEPKSPEGLANAMQKVADTYARVTDEGDLKPQAIEITITGMPPALEPPRDAVTVQLIGSEPDKQCLPSTSTGDSSMCIEQTPETKSSLVDDA